MEKALFLLEAFVEGDHPLKVRSQMEPPQRQLGLVSGTPTGNAHPEPLSECGEHSSGYEELFIEVKTLSPVEATFKAITPPESAAQVDLLKDPLHKVFSLEISGSI
jgi:hypothetical protein